MDFEIGRPYSNDQILESLGGSRIGYLQNIGTDNAYGRFSKEMNPQAPFEIWVEDKPMVRRHAERLFELGREIHVFQRQRERDFDYIYRGRFRPQGALISDPYILNLKWERLTKKRPLAYVFRLEQLRIS